MSKKQFDPLLPITEEDEIAVGIQTTQMIQPNQTIQINQQQQINQNESIKQKQPQDHPSEILKTLHKRIKSLFDLELKDIVIFNNIDEEDIDYNLQTKIYDWNVFETLVHEKPKYQQKNIVLTSKEFTTKEPKYQLQYSADNVYKLVKFCFYYFEITIEGNKPNVSIGLVNELGLDRSFHIGRYKDSVGLCANGQIYIDNANCQKCTKPFKSGDIIGCGYNPGSGCFFFTKNGEYLGMVGGDDYRFFAIALESYTKVTINTGKRPFKFDLPKFFNAWNNK